MGSNVMFIMVSLMLMRMSLSASSPYYYPSPSSSPPPPPPSFPPSSSSPPPPPSFPPPPSSSPPPPPSFPPPSSSSPPPPPSFTPSSSPPPPPPPPSFTPSSSLTRSHYDRICPAALPTIERVVRAAIRREPRMGASLLRLHFHDCFVNGCDGSVLLDPSPAFEGEKNAIPNVGSLRGFEVVDQIKAAVDKICRRPVVSCADILAVAARDSVVALGGPSWRVLLGRRDSTTASSAATVDLPPPFLNVSGLIANFQKQGLNVVDLVALSGGHTLGFSRCQNFRNRIYNETNINPIFAKRTQKICPLTGGNTNLAGFDPTAFVFDTKYFTSLIKREGLLHSDQELFNGGAATDAIVRTFSQNPRAFAAAFAQSMINMGNIKPLTGTSGQIRVNCRKVNA